MFFDAAKSGVLNMWRCGITTIADTGTSGATVRALSELGGRGLYFHEAITPDPAAVDRVFVGFVNRVQELRTAAGQGVHVGVSPHAPFTAHESLYRRVVEFANAESLPIAGHVAESAVETAFVRDGSGPFADLWRERGLALPPPRRSAVQFAADNGLLAPHTLVIHVAQADDSDIALLAGCDVAVACCPRSNRAHGHGDPPLAAFLDANLRVGLGTDSIASVATVDVLAEARAACELTQLDAEQALRLVTHDAARALRMDGQVGSIAPGLAGDLAVIDVRDVAGPLGAQAVLDEAAYVAATLVNGRFVFSGAS